MTYSPTSFSADAVFESKQFPAVAPDLTSGLADVNHDALAHLEVGVDAAAAFELQQVVQPAAVFYVPIATAN